MSIEKKTRTSKNFFIIDHYRSGVLVDHEYLRPPKVAERINERAEEKVFFEHIGFLNDGTAIFNEWGDQKTFYTLSELGEKYHDLITQ
jgi:hypothetical protein